MKSIVHIIEIDELCGDFKNFQQIMKRFLVVVSVLLLIIILATSCMTGQKCSAYGERQRYQIERH